MEKRLTADEMVREYYFAKGNDGISIGQSAVSYVDEKIKQAMENGDWSLSLDYNSLDYKALGEHYEARGFETNYVDISYDGGKPFGPHKFIIKWGKRVPLGHGKGERE